MIYLSKSSLNVVNISLVMSMRCSFCSKFNNFGIILIAVRFMPKTYVKIAWQEPNDMATFLKVILLSKIIFSNALMFSYVVDGDNSNFIIQNYFLQCCYYFCFYFFSYVVDVLVIIDVEVIDIFLAFLKLVITTIELVFRL